jgi:hypothetical protein
VNLTEKTAAQKAIILITIQNVLFRTAAPVRNFSVLKRVSKTLSVIKAT